ncbi:hypothetical protein ACX27_09810 [Nostoc piscinale CENA21]|uniref:Uncharacterized protein n=1 Tax=Nostoc piscinale CENA21 TaxID=224013 RepID=A0A0M4TVJ4_9NOSO|nr:hypothetical protein [Nostoc piscinale]ALF53076.1 hypothetical protein ACX27_09810 [Nostoc piscinale CENA21]
MIALTLIKVAITSINVNANEAVGNRTQILQPSVCWFRSSRTPIAAPKVGNAENSCVYRVIKVLQGLVFAF